jgi:ADP-heptose:LPS heptosyltransferase
LKFSLSNLLARAYRKTGIHGAPPGTILYCINARVHYFVHRRIRKYANVHFMARGAFGASPYYNVVLARQERDISGIALIFFLGVGDYMMATPLIEALHAKYPDLPITAYVSSTADSVNSPLVAQLLRINPLISKVATYKGKARSLWTDYDFTDALKQIPSDVLILPVIYDTAVNVWHRATALYETFGLEVQFPVPRPIAYKTQMTPAAQNYLAAILEKYRSKPSRGLVCLHFGARSSGYEYPHAARLSAFLIQRGYQLVSFSPTNHQDENLTEIDITKLTVPDSIEILRGLKEAGANPGLISVNSLMWPISTALNIPNLGLHTFWDSAIHQYLYPNIYAVTQHAYATLPPCRFILAPYGAYEERQPRDLPIKFTDYNPDFVADSYDAMFTHAQAGL